MEKIEAASGPRMTLRDSIAAYVAQGVRETLPHATMQHGPRDFVITGLGWQVKVIVEPMQPEVLGDLDKEC